MLRNLLRASVELRPHVVVAGAQFFQRHVQLEDFFEQLRRHVAWLRCSPISKPSSFSTYSARGDRVAQRPVGVVEDGGGVQRVLLLAAALRAV